MSYKQTKKKKKKLFVNNQRVISKRVGKISALTITTQNTDNFSPAINARYTTESLFLWMKSPLHENFP